ncbi:Endo-1,3;1,4-beta-D-glucanase [Vitis vinifera]|uniref:Endo-1,31,4-beta-D-glucanase n=1 Tax=Vitis vinifera TaxID=29760 RepID=A0A438KLJ0_VITVI|nr:Endo-1,3;1,4-beta-D-glucanase [Vitis vinifera]
MSISRCYENPPSFSPGSGAGTVQEVGGGGRLKAYVTGPLDSKLAILFVSDVFDKVAAAGFLVVAPDFFYGDPVDLSNPNFDRQVWIAAHGTDKGCEDAKAVIAALRSKGVSAIGAAGFCWGGKVVVNLASSDHIQAAVVLHPGRITDDEINEVKTPIAILGAEIDDASPPEQLEHFGEILSAKSGMDCFVKIFPGVAHGWTVRYSVEDEWGVKSAEEAHGDMLNWFRLISSHLKAFFQCLR